MSDIEVITMPLLSESMTGTIAAAGGRRVYSYREQNVHYSWLPYTPSYISCVTAPQRMGQE